MRTYTLHWTLRNVSRLLLIPAHRTICFQPKSIFKMISLIILIKSKKKESKAIPITGHGGL
jgi:hypothetical protein